MFRTSDCVSADRINEDCLILKIIGTKTFYLERDVLLGFDEEGLCRQPEGKKKTKNVLAAGRAWPSIQKRTLYGIYRVCVTNEHMHENHNALIVKYFILFFKENGS